MLKSNKGVTLVALVITIIVLLILAGVSISLVVGDNGVLNQAVNAADATNKAAVESEVGMAVTAVQADWTAQKYAGETNPGDLASYMTKARVTAEMDSSFVINETDITPVKGNGTAITVTYKGVTYKLTLTLTDSGNSVKVSTATAQ